MESTPNPPSTPELLADLDWLHGLARRLLGGSSDADDAVQETWLAARRRMAARGEAGAPDRGVLARTLGGVVLHARRAAGRRRYHENEAALGRAGAAELPSTEELLLAGERQQWLWGHLVALDEPFRTTLLLRFQRGLETNTLAEQLGVARDTARWRVRRGLELLRASIEREEGGPGLMGLAPIAALGPPSLSAAATGTGSVPAHTLAATGARTAATWMMHKSLTVFAAAALGLLGMLLWTLQSSPQPGSEPIAAASTATLDPIGAAAPPDTDGPRAQRMDGAERAQVPTRDVPSAGGSGQAVVTGCVIDERGRPVDAAPIVVERRSEWTISTNTGPDGRFEAVCPAQTHAHVQVRVEAFANYRARSISLGSGRNCTLPPLSEAHVDVGDLRLRDGGRIVGRLIDAVGAPVEGVRVSGDGGYDGVLTLPDGTFDLGDLDLGENRLMTDSNDYETLVVPVFLKRGSPADLDELTLVERPWVTVRGRVVDAGGRALEGATVASGDSRAVTSPDGRFELRTRAQGAKRDHERAYLKAYAPGYRRSPSTYCQDGGSVTIVLHASGQIVVHQVVDRATGGPLEGATVEAQEIPGHALGRLGGERLRDAVRPGTKDERSGPDGMLELAGYEGAERLRVRAPGYKARTVAFEVPANDVRVVALDREPRARIHGRVPVVARTVKNARLEIQNLTHLGDLGPAGDEGRWVHPPQEARGAEGAARLDDWIQARPAMRSTGRHPVRFAQDGSFTYASACSQVQRAVVRWGGDQIAVSRPFWARAGEEIEVEGWSRSTLGSVRGTVTLPHPDLAAEITLELETHGSRTGSVDSGGRFAIDRVDPGAYALRPTSLPDGFPNTPFERIVHVPSGGATGVDIDPGVAPYGELEVHVRINGEVPRHGFGLRLTAPSGQSHYTWSDGTLAHILVPAADGYRVDVEPEVPHRDNAGWELTRTFDVRGGAQRIDLDLQTAHLVCALGPRIRASLEDTEQVLRWRDPGGEERAPIFAALLVHNTSGRSGDRIEIEFLNVPIGARDLRLELDGAADAACALTPVEVLLVAGERVRVEVD